MKRIWIATLGIMLAAATAFGQTAEKWIHIRVIGHTERAESVRVNVPVSVAEQVLPAIDANRLHHGVVTIDNKKLQGVDVKALLDAVRNAPDNEFVSVKSKDEDVHVSKSGAYFLVKVRDNKGEKAENVDVKVPIAVVNALLSSGNDQLNVLAALQTLKTFGDTELVSVNDGEQSVRIWIDSRSDAE